MSLGGYCRRSSYWFNDSIHGSPVRNHFKDISFIMGNREEGDRLIRIHLANLLDHATRNSEFYKKYRGYSFNQLPVMDKLMILENYDKIFINDAWDVRSGYIARTSGSTGIPFEVHQDGRKRDRVIAELKYFGEKCGYMSHERMAHLRVWDNRKKTKWQEFTQNIICVDVSRLDDDNLLKILELLKRRRVRAIFSYANTLDFLVGYIHKNPASAKGLRINTIVAGAEALNPDTSRELKKLFGCTVVSKYSNSENGIFSQMLSEDGTFKLNHASYYFEILRFDSEEPASLGEPGRIVVTDLFNYAFPMIRYDTGDAGIMTEGNEKTCNRPVLSELYGRRMEIIYDTSGKPVNPLIVWAYMREKTDLLQWQFIQKKDKQYVIKANTDKDIDLNPAVGKLKQILGSDAEILIERVDEMPVTFSGKRRLTMCEL